MVSAVSDPVVAITNFLLTAECWFFAARLAQGRGASAVTAWYCALFLLLGLGAFFGGITHGFMTDASGLGAKVIWRATLVCLGAASLATTMIAVEIAMPHGQKEKAKWLLGMMFLAYLLTVMFVTQDYVIAIAGSLPAVLALMATLTWLIWKTGSRGILLGLSGLALTLVGAVQQQLQMRIDPVWFDYNAVYHAIQIVAFLLIYLGVFPIARAAKGTS